MEKNMDSYADSFLALVQARAEATKLRRELSSLDKKIKSLNSFLVDKMGRSTVGIIAGREMFEIQDTKRTTYTEAKVMEVCPELADQLATVHRGKKIALLPSAIAID